MNYKEKELGYFTIIWGFMDILVRNSIAGAKDQVHNMLVQIVEQHI